MAGIFDTGIFDTGIFDHAEEVATEAPRNGFAGGRWNERKAYLIKGRRYWLTDYELSILLRQMLEEVKRADIIVDAPKPKVLSRRTWAKLKQSLAALEAVAEPAQPEDVWSEDDDEAALLMLL